MSSGARDYVLIAVAIGAVYLVLALYAGNLVPVRVVETNSMMHVDARDYSRADGVGFGRLGTIDPGDLILLRSVDEVSDVETFVQASGDRYGARGDVIAYNRPNNDDGRPIMHRAMTYVDVQGSGDAITFRVLWSPLWTERGDCVRTPVYTCIFDLEEGVTIRELGITEERFTHSGFITKGDNPISNPGADQAPPAGPNAQPLMPQPVRIEDIVGEAQGEVPAFGLLRLVVTGETIRNAEVKDHSDFVQIGNVVAPWDLWGLVVLELTAISLFPVMVSVVRDVTAKPSRPVVGELSVLERAWREHRDRAPPAGPGTGSDGHERGRPPVP